MIGLIFAFASLYSSILLYKNSRGIGLSAFASSGGDVSLSVEGDDTTFPSVSIVDPTNITYNSQRTGIDYTASDNAGLDSCWYSLDSGTTNTSITCGNNVTGITSSTGGNTWRVYVNDTSGNENSSSVSFTVSIAAPDGGGGGSGTSRTAGRLEKFEINPEEINLVIDAGKRDFREIKVRNTGGKTLTINISVIGISEIVSADFNYLTISPGEERSVLISIDAPDEGGIFTGRIIFQSGNVRRDVLVSVNVRSGEILFDVSLTILESFRVILPGQNVSPIVSISQVGPADQEVEAIVTYLIKDFDGNTLFTETETLSILEGKNLVKEFITEDYPPGDYIAGIEVAYTKGLATSSDRFTIAKKPFNIILLILLILAILVVILIIRAIIIRAIRRYKKSGRHSRNER